MQKNQIFKLWRVVLASGNYGKLKEFRNILKPLNIEVLSQGEFNVGSVEETGLTFVENAILKARHAAALTALPVIADDSGLEVDALNGEPGIHSARYAGKGASDMDNNTKLLSQLSGISLNERTARFCCTLVYLRHKYDPMPVICQANWEGLILDDIRGTGGFGYDPLFFVPSEQCTSAELSSEAKNRLSHRARAMKILTERLKVRC